MRVGFSARGPLTHARRSFITNFILSESSSFHQNHKILEKLLPFWESTPARSLSAVCGAGAPARVSPESRTLMQSDLKSGKATTSVVSPEPGRA
jgi:hypothetical protein